MKYSWAKLAVSMVLVVWYFGMPQYSFGGYDIATYGTIWEHLLYPLSHANVWHLGANVLCLWMITCRLHLASSYFVAVVCSFLPCFVSEATMGFSGMLFAIVGMSWGRVGRFKDMIWKNKWFLLIPLFLPHVNGLLHLYCLVAGWLIGRCVGNATYGTDWV